MPEIEIITTSDGSHSLRNKELNETYHSIHGAIQESVHVYINNGLLFFEHQNHPASVSILEIGFGTGLNALLSVQHALHSDMQIHYTSLEAYPVDEETAIQLNYPAALNFEKAESAFQRLHTASWTAEESVLSNFILRKYLVKFQEATLGVNRFDVVYFDAFAPAKQPEMWEISLLHKVEQSMRPGGVFVTYCAKGQLKRDLKMLGFQVETLPGPPGKKEMVRGLKN